jgi:hypothetical protein
MLAASIGWLIISLLELTYFGDQVLFGGRLPRPVQGILVSTGSAAIVVSLFLYGVALRRKEIVLPKRDIAVGVIAVVATVLVLVLVYVALLR